MQGFLYSQNLIQETIQCFKDENKLTITPEQANEYLNELGGLFVALSSSPHKRAKELFLDTCIDSKRTMGVSNTHGTL